MNPFPIALGQPYIHVGFGHWVIPTTSTFNPILKRSRKGPDKYRCVFCILVDDPDHFETTSEKNFRSHLMLHVMAGHKCGNDNLKSFMK